MNLNFNKVAIAGNLTKDPDTFVSKEGEDVANCALAVNSYGNRDKVCYVDVVAFGRTAQLIGERLEKGHNLLVHGRLDQDRWESEDGQYRSTHKIIAQEIHFLTARPKDETQETALAGADEGEVPF